MTDAAKRDGAKRAQRYRDKMRAAGLRPVQVWAWDTSRPGFAEECRRQSLLVRDDPQERQVMDEMASVADWNDWR